MDYSLRGATFKCYCGYRSSHLPSLLAFLSIRHCHILWLKWYYTEVRIVQEGNSLWLVFLGGGVVLSSWSPRIVTVLLIYFWFWNWKNSRSPPPHMPGKVAESLMQPRFANCCYKEYFTDHAFIQKKTPAMCSVQSPAHAGSVFSLVL